MIALIRIAFKIKCPKYVPINFILVHYPLMETLTNEKNYSWICRNRREVETNALVIWGICQI